MEYKLSKNIKGIFLFNIFLFATGLCLDNIVAISASAVVFVVLSVSIEILESIYDNSGKG